MTQGAFELIGERGGVSPTVVTLSAKHRSETLLAEGASLG